MRTRQQKFKFKKKKKKQTNKQTNDMGYILETWWLYCLILFGLRCFDILFLFRFQHGPRHFPGERVLSGIRQAETGGGKKKK